MKENGHILVFVTQLLENGGIESHLKEFCKNLKSDGVNIDLVVLNSQISNKTKEEYKINCNSLYLGSFRRSKLRMFWLILIGLRLSLTRYNSLYTNGQGESILVFSKLIFIKEKWVHHHHTAGDESDQLSWGSNYKSVLSKADTIIACSSKNSKDISKFINRSVSVIPCFSRNFNFELFERKAGKFRIGYYGRLIKEKGIDILCKLSGEEEFKEVEFHIWGRGETYNAIFFKAFPNIFFHGSFESDSELTEILKFLDAFILLSSHPEGLPVCLLECMGAGVPWIATDKGGISDIALCENATKVIPNDLPFKNLKIILQEFIQNIQLYNFDNSCQVSFYEKNFSFHSLTHKWRIELGV